MKAVDHFGFELTDVLIAFRSLCMTPYLIHLAKRVLAHLLLHSKAPLPFFYSLSFDTGYDLVPVILFIDVNHFTSVRHIDSILVLVKIHSQ